MYTVRLQLVERGVGSFRDYLQVAELRVFDENDINVASTGYAVASSGSSQSAYNVRDGTTTTYYSSANGADSWVELRFNGLGRTVSRVEIVLLTGFEYRFFPSRLTLTTLDNGR